MGKMRKEKMRLATPVVMGRMRKGTALVRSSAGRVLVWLHIGPHETIVSPSKTKGRFANSLPITSVNIKYVIRLPSE